MKPEKTADNYDRIATWWRERHSESNNGVEQLKRAIFFCENKKLALDVGCGSSGRFIGILQEHGFTVEGMDSSSEMIRQARKTSPDCEYYVADVSSWKLPKQYDFISAWDSTFHLPVDL